MGSNPGQPGKKIVKNDFTNQVKLNSAHLDIIYNSKLRLVHKYKMHHGTAIRRCRPDPNYFAGTAGRVVRASACNATL